MLTYNRIELHDERSSSLVHRLRDVSGVVVRSFVRPSVCSFSTSIPAGERSPTLAVQTVATAVFMEMNLGSLNPLFARRCAAVRRHLPTYLPRLNLHYTSTTSLSLPRSPPLLLCARTFSTSFSRARARPCRFARFILFLSHFATPSLSVFPRSSPHVSASSPLLLSASLDCLLARSLLVSCEQIHARSCRRCLPT